MITVMCTSIANYIIKQTNSFNEKRAYSEQIPMTSKRLQKLLFFSDIQYMKNHAGQSMFEDNFYAWPSGPVIPTVYYKFMRYQNGTMQPLDDAPILLDDDIKKAVDFVLKRTNDMDTIDLVECSHISGGPWAHAYMADDIDHNQIIPKSAIYEFYKGRDAFQSLEIVG